MITHITCQHALSGIGRYGIELTKELHNRGVIDYWYKPFKKGHPDSYLHNESWIKGYSYKSFRDLHPYILPYFIKYGVGGQRKFAHAHWFLSGLGAIKAGYENIVVTMHDVSLLHESEQSGSYERYYKSAIDQFKKRDIPIVTVSETARKDTILYAEYPEELVFAVPNGIDFQQFYPKQKAASDNFTIVYSGGLGKRKNLGLLLEAFQRLERKHDFVRLKIAGAHPERTPYLQMAADLGIRNVTFTGFIPDENMADFYHSGDVMVFPSLYEGFGFSPLEAMACGTPVLSAKGGALEEISGPGAQLFDYEVEDLFQNLEQLIISPEQRGLLAQKGGEWVKQYTWAASADKTMEVYSSVFPR